MEHVFKLFEFNVYNDKGLDKDSDEDEAYKENKDNSRFIIQMFGINEEGKKASIIVEEYQPFFYVKVDNNWGQTKKTAFYNHLKLNFYQYLSFLDFYSLLSHIIHYYSLIILKIPRHNIVPVIF